MLYGTIKGADDDKIVIGIMDEISALDHLRQSQFIKAIDKNNRMYDIRISFVKIQQGVTPCGDRPVKVNCYRKGEEWTMKIGLIKILPERK